VARDQEEDQTSYSEASDDDSSELLPGVDVKKRDACRLIRELRKVAYELRGPWEGKAKKPERKVYRAYLTLEDLVGVHHLRHLVGRREELQTTLTQPHQFRKTLIRVYRLKNLKWTHYRVDGEGNRVLMPQLMQILEEEAEHVIAIEDQKRKRFRTGKPETSER
jgi:hypothetical protein